MTLTEEIRTMLAQAGFTKIGVEPMEDDLREWFMKESPWDVLDGAILVGSVAIVANKWGMRQHQVSHVVFERGDDDWSRDGVPLREDGSWRSRSAGGCGGDLRDALALAIKIVARQRLVDRTATGRRGRERSKG